MGGCMGGEVERWLVGVTANVYGALLKLESRWQAFRWSIYYQLTHAWKLSSQKNTRTGWQVFNEPGVCMGSDPEILLPSVCVTGGRLTVCPHPTPTPNDNLGLAQAGL